MCRRTNTRGINLTLSPLTPISIIIIHKYGVNTRILNEFDVKLCGIIDHLKKKKRKRYRSPATRSAAQSKAVGTAEHAALTPSAYST